MTTTKAMRSNLSQAETADWQRRFKSLTSAQRDVYNAAIFLTMKRQARGSSVPATSIDLLVSIAAGASAVDAAKGAGIHLDRVDLLKAAAAANNLKEQGPWKAYVAYKRTASGQALYDEAEERALKEKRSGATHSGIGKIFEQIRWDGKTTRRIGQGDEDWRVNHNYRSSMARDLMSRNPELLGFFTVKGPDSALYAASAKTRDDAEAKRHADGYFRLDEPGYFGSFLSDSD